MLLLCVDFSYITLVAELAGSLYQDLQPCILASSSITRDDTGDAYLISTFYKGYWGATQLAPAATTGTLDLTNSATSGKCNVVYVAVVVNAAQKLQLQDYSRTFKVRIVYLNAAKTAEDSEVLDRLGIAEDWAAPLLLAPFIKLAAAGADMARVVPSTLTTDPREELLFTRPVYLLPTGPTTGTCIVIAEYVDANGAAVLSSQSRPSAPAVVHTSDDGVEEMHVFFDLGWYDVGSWAWGHFIVEWGTKGVFQGERKFFLAGMVDDLFLKTPVFSYNGGNNEGPEVRVSSSEMADFAAFESSLNARYNSEIVTEWPFNGLGVLDEVGSAYRPDFPDADIAFLPKGQQVIGKGVPPQIATDWLEVAVPGMTEEFNQGRWASDALLSWVLDNLDVFWWQSHTLGHMARDNLGQSDCSIEDGGNAQFAVLTGLFSSNSYSWRSQTMPRISGLFNKYCLRSSTANLMTCAPGDNTFDGVYSDVSLVSDVSEFHSLYTTDATSGFDGFQIVPRFASYVYYNCVTGECLVAENEYTERLVCGCSNLNPDEDKGTCTLCTDDEYFSFGSVDKLFEHEAKSATRNILKGRRDKYMFHQANVASTDLPGGSLLAYWYEQVMEMLTSYIAFPVTSNKFDDQCAEFGQHEDLDASGAVLTATVDNETGDISSVSLTASGTAGVIPFTVPSTNTVSTAGLTVGRTTTYGSDTVFYLATSAGAVPTPASAPDPSELAPIATTSPAPTAEPEPTTEPSTPEPVAPVSTPEPVAPISAPTPVAAPVLLGEGIAANFVEVASGGALVAVPVNQAWGEPTAVAEEGDISDTTTSIKLASNATSQAEYNFYFPAPAALSGDYTITVTAQLGDGATAAHWRVDMFDFLETETWEPLGDLKGVTLEAWTTSTFTVATTTPQNFVSAEDVLLVRLHTVGATGVEAIYVDHVAVYTGTTV
eukprot:g13275.t1